jgi:DUF2934 family protein
MAAKAKKSMNPMRGTALSQPAQVPPAGARQPTEEEIRLLAYHKWMSAGCPEGDGIAFWLEAEQELNPREMGRRAPRADMDIEC